MNMFAYLLYLTFPFCQFSGLSYFLKKKSNHSKTFSGKHFGGYHGNIHFAFWGGGCKAV